MSEAPPLAPPEQVATISIYAEICAELASGRLPEEVLPQRRLDEPGWARADEYWQARLSDAMEVEQEGVPALVTEYAEAFSRAMPRPGGAEPALSLEAFARATEAIRRRGDAVLALKELGIPVTDFLLANEVWTPQIARDPKMAQRFLDAQGPTAARAKT